VHGVSPRPARATGDRPARIGRLVEKLSPGMCTGWGCACGPAHVGSPTRTVHHRALLGGLRAGPGPYLQCDVIRAADLQLCKTPGRGAGPRGGLRTGWGSAGGSPGTDRGRGRRRVHGRRDVHVSTTGRRRPPTVGQHVDSGADLRGRGFSPASTPVMTRMREISRGFLEPQSGWGSRSGRGPIRARTGHREAGVSPWTTAPGTMSNAECTGGPARGDGTAAVDGRGLS
jgi:hypothetical protein